MNIKQRLSKLEEHSPELPVTTVYLNNWRHDGAMTHQDKPITAADLTALRLTHQIITVEYVKTWPPDGAGRA